MEGTEDHRQLVHLLLRSGDQVLPLPGQQRVRGSFWANRVTERAFGSGMRVQRGAVVLGGLINQRG
jgi:hypothetical protein